MKKSRRKTWAQALFSCIILAVVVFGSIGILFSSLRNDLHEVVGKLDTAFSQEEINKAVREGVEQGLCEVAEEELAKMGVMTIEGSCKMVD